MDRQVLARYGVSVGAAEDPATKPSSDTLIKHDENGLGTIQQLGSTAGVVLGAYHGYKRNDSVGWAIGWALLGGLFWPITIPVSIAQGFGQPHK